MADVSFRDFILDQLEPLDGLKTRAMFGAYGLYLGDVFFGIISGGRLYFKTGASNRSDFVDKGMQPFRPNEKQTLKNYFEVPAEVLEDKDELQRWAVRSAFVDR